METLLSVFGTLLAVLAVCALAYYVTRQMAVSGALGKFRSVDAQGRLSVLSQLGVGKEERLLVVAVGERCFLLGVTPAGISMLAELTGQEADAWRQTAQAEPAPPSFLDSLRACMGRKK